MCDTGRTTAACETVEANGSGTTCAIVACLADTGTGRVVAGTPEGTTCAEGTQLSPDDPSSVRSIGTAFDVSGASGSGVVTIVLERAHTDAHDCTALFVDVAAPGTDAIATLEAAGTAAANAAAVACGAASAG